MILRRMLLAALLLALGCVGVAGAEESGYRSDFTGDTDGWYARSMGSASLALTEDGGSALEQAFRVHLHERDRIPEDTPPRMMLKAGYRIQQIKKRMNNGEFATTDRKRMAIAELVACR